ncbi:Gfo/Idh/MocA family protein [Gryllotalpicola ginsengisoli]|uniref:Gfo/Idh/MocA family protein n=1 Tax=Gryllotalpicola ginsengisoli TaxID=444608 RepID=UPI0003B51F7F|nr:Gfo/Idh/MocA family oxidoreductase [Gryllotalpicola ginsengisoli]
MTGPVRVGIVGTGGIAQVHARALNSLGDRVVIAGACDIDESRVRAFQQEWGVEEGFGGIEELLDGVELDLVHLCSPPGLHKEQALAALGRGVHVLSEKPPALSLAELDEIDAAQRASGAYFATVSQHRFGGRAEWLRARIADGSLGRPLTAVCNTLWYRPDSYFEVPWRGNWQIEGGGPTMGHGIHQMDTMLSILGPWSEVVAAAARNARPVLTEDLSHAIVTLENGVLVSVVNSLLSPKETSYLRFDFEFATVELEHLYGYSDDNWSITPAPGHEDDVAAAWSLGPHGRGSGHGAQFAAVLDALEAGRPLPVELPSARSTLELIAGIYASAFTGARVRPGDIGPDSPFYASMEGSGAPWGERVAHPA